MQERKIGHLGTLDPFATGLLPLCLGRATKLAPYLMPGAKTYRATLKLGVATDTQDLTGREITRTETLPTPEQVYQAAAGLVGEIEQVPPMHSALHHQGERLYKLARRGETVDRAPRRVTIYRLEVEAVDLPQAIITVQCSRALTSAPWPQTWARSWVRGHLTALRRLAVGSFGVEAALTLTGLEEAGPMHAWLGLFPCTPVSRECRRWKSTLLRPRNCARVRP